jgi:hypothetical protein
VVLVFENVVWNSWDNGAYSFLILKLLMEIVLNAKRGKQTVILLLSFVRVLFICFDENSLPVIVECVNCWE